MKSTQADVVVIGAGVLGTSCAFHLADAGVQNVVVLDRGTIGGGTTQFAAGQTGHLRSDRISLEFTSYCADFFENFEDKTGHAVDFHQYGSLRIALTEAYVTDLEQRVEAAKSIGQKTHYLSVPEALKLVPSLRLEPTAQILLSPRDGFVEPRSVAVAYAAAAIDHGARILTGTAVEDVLTSGGRVRGVQTSIGVIETERVVLAAGAWTRLLGERFGLNIQVVPVRHQLYVTAPLSCVREDQPIVRITEPQLYARQHMGGLMVGGYGYRPMSFEMEDFPEDFEIPALSADHIYYQEMHEAALPFFPDLEKVPIVEQRRGLPTMAPDGQSIASNVEGLDGLIVASACSVGGVLHSPGIGRIVADIVTDRPKWLPADGLSATRFGSEFDNNAHLREACEAVYARMYRDKI